MNVLFKSFYNISEFRINLLHNRIIKREEDTYINIIFKPLTEWVSDI